VIVGKRHAELSSAVLRHYDTLLNTVGKKCKGQQQIVQESKREHSSNDSVYWCLAISAYANVTPQ
jgi:hypothetical protein